MPSADFLPMPEMASDADLVSATLGGNRSAFTAIVARYQRLLCSLAYARIGSVSESEDVAQEAFITAWQELGKLQEPEKLRPWLCTILRHKLGRRFRSDGREPARMATPIEDAGELDSNQTPTPDQTMHEEEQALMWKALEQIPELYREPLVLFYREHQSVEHVAAALDLTEDTVKQRLARGRKLLQEQVLSFVEGALARSTPGRVFTAAVLAALPTLIPAPVKAAAVGTTVVVKGTVLAKTTWMAVGVASLSSLVGGIIGLRTNLMQARTRAERRLVVKITAIAFLGCALYLLALYGLRELAGHFPALALPSTIAAQVSVVVMAVLCPWSLVRAMRAGRQLRSSERVAHPESFTSPVDAVGSAASEYRSRWKLLGIPLVTTRFAQADAGQRPVVGWFAGGDRAVGLLCAWGGVAIAPISVGACSIGIISFGSVSFGLFSVGTLAVGGFALGTVAMGVRAFAWLSALGGYSAQSGGFSVARIVAQGPFAYAKVANGPDAAALLADPSIERNLMFAIMASSVMALVPVIIYAKAVSRRIGPRR